MRSITVTRVLAVWTVGLAVASTANALPDDHSWPQDCGRCPAPILEKLGLNEFVTAQTAKNVNAAAYAGRMAGFEVCADPRGCNYNIDVTIENGKCVATLPYCGLCVRNNVPRISWTLVTTTGRTFTFGSTAIPNDGIVLKRPTSRRPAGPLLTHFRDKRKVSAVRYTWERGAHPTWGPISLPRHGHDAVVSELNGTSIGAACTVVDPPILNTIN